MWGSFLSSGPQINQNSRSGGENGFKPWKELIQMAVIGNLMEIMYIYVQIISLKVLLLLELAKPWVDLWLF